MRTYLYNLLTSYKVKLYIHKGLLKLDALLKSYNVFPSRAATPVEPPPQKHQNTISYVLYIMSPPHKAIASNKEARVLLAI